MMNAKKMEKWILLEQTGELSPRRQALLNACSEARAMRNELNALGDAVPSVDVEPSPWAATRIQARLQKERRSVLLPARVWQPVLALAACLTLVVTTLDFVPGSFVESNSGSSPTSVANVAVGEVDAWGVEFEEDLAELESLILDISDTSFDFAGM